MTVKSNTLQIVPFAPIAIGGSVDATIADNVLGDITWSNEITNHTVEIKFTKPESDIWKKESVLQKNIENVNEKLKLYSACLLPTGIHPFMDPKNEGALWQGEGYEIYKRYSELFDCNQHGWKNVQSIHINEPFDSNKSFGTLHAAIRVLVPILPALAASSPIIEGAKSPYADARLFAYKEHQKLLPQTMGTVVPEPIFDIDEYQTTILQPIATAIAPYNSDHMLLPQFMNARGAIARFDRSAIEIRVIDVQESIRANLSVCSIVHTVLQCLAAEEWSTEAEQKSFPQEPLVELLWQTASAGDNALIENREYLELFGCSSPCSAHDLWEKIIMNIWEKLPKEAHEWCNLYILSGSLSRRILQNLEEENGDIQQTYQALAQNLQENTFLR